MKLIGYLRVSTNEQMDGYGMDAQESAIRAWAKANGHRIVKILRDEGVSGALEHVDRPALSSALLAIEEGDADGLLIPRLDRLARALTVQEATLAYIWRTGAKVFTADAGEVLQDDPDDPMRTALRQVVGVFAELDRRMTVKRLRDGRKEKAAQGRKATGAYAYGTRATGKGKQRDAGPDTAEQKALALMLKMRAAGASYPQICAELNSQGIKPRRSESWSAMTVRRIILRQTAGS
jgi:DNA invertase Pin-like site-specific DNA recombinase